MPSVETIRPGSDGEGWAAAGVARTEFPPVEAHAHAVPERSTMAARAELRIEALGRFVEHGDVMASRPSCPLPASARKIQDGCDGPRLFLSPTFLPVGAWCPSPRSAEVIPSSRLVR